MAAHRRSAFEVEVLDCCHVIECNKCNFYFTAMLIAKSQKKAHACILKRFLPCYRKNENQTRKLTATITTEAIASQKHCNATLNLFYHVDYTVLITRLREVGRAVANFGKDTVSSYLLGLNLKGIYRYT